MANVRGIPSSIEDMDGSTVHEAYYKDSDMDRIIEYCELDVIILAQVFLKLKNKELLIESGISKVI